ncbi:MAG: hypothetical protein IT435_17725 [Phycisphaerales bacterium]|nr:hypothetical protein [Phycisphaerales bacterium]
MKGPVFALVPAMLPIADAAIERLCGERNWLLIAKNVRSTHVHVVVNCRGCSSPERAMAQFKARITRDLRIAGLVLPEARIWTHHGSTRWINHEAGLSGAITHVSEWQAGPNREILERHRAELRERLDAMKAWLRSQGLPEHGRTAVIGEDEEDRRRRLFTGMHDEPRTK